MRALRDYAGTAARLHKYGEQPGSPCSCSVAFNACAFGQDMAPLCLPDKRTARHNRAEKFPKASGPNRR